MTDDKEHFVLADKNGIPDLVCIGLFLVFISIFFAKTIFFGQAITHLNSLSQTDAFWNPSSKGCIVWNHYDPSLYLVGAPLIILIQKLVLSGQLPLWSPYNSCGMPLIFDPEFMALSLNRWLFSPLFPYLYNLGIVAKVAMAGVGTYIFARLMKLPPLLSLFACITFVCCPFVLWQEELPFESWLYPFTFCAFVITARMRKHLEGGSVFRFLCCFCCSVQPSKYNHEFNGLRVHFRPC